MTWLAERLTRTCGDKTDGCTRYPALTDRAGTRWCAYCGGCTALPAPEPQGSSGEQEPFGTPVEEPVSSQEREADVIAAGGWP